MHCPTLQNVTFWRATRCGWWIFDKIFVKMPKITISWCKMYKPGNSGWNQISGHGGITMMTALPDMNIFCQILVIFFFFLNFLSNFWQTTSGSSPKHDILTRWQKLVWEIYNLCVFFFAIFWQIISMSSIFNFRCQINVRCYKNIRWNLTFNVIFWGDIT